MGRKSRKKSNRLPKWMSDDGVTKKQATELEEQMINIEYDERYYTIEEKREIESFIMQFGNCIWSGLGTCPGPCMEVFSLEAQKEARGYSLWYGKKVSQIMDKDKWTIQENFDIVTVLLTAEAIKKRFENVLLYTRFIESIIIDCDEDTGESTIVDIKEQGIFKHYLHSYWMLRKRGVFVHMAKKKSTHIWEIPETGQNAALTLAWD